MLVFFEDHPEVGKTYQLTNAVTGETSIRTVQQRLKQSRYSEVFRCRQYYFEAVMVDRDGTIITAEYEIRD